MEGSFQSNFQNLQPNLLHSLALPNVLVPGAAKKQREVGGLGRLVGRGSRVQQGQVFLHSLAGARVGVPNIRIRARRGVIASIRVAGIVISRATGQEGKQG